MSLRLSTVKDHHHHAHETHERHHEEDHEDDVMVDFGPIRIFDAQHLGEEVSRGFDAVRIAIDGRVKADLAWSQVQDVARKYVDAGLKIFWDIDLGLFKGLEKSLDNTGQFLALGLSLEHFKDTLWREFHSETVGLSLYRGTGEFSAVVPWDEKQESNMKAWLKDLEIESVLPGSANWEFLKKLFCRDVAAEYLEMLAARLPDMLPCFVLMDIADISDPYMCAQVLNKERYPRLSLGVMGNLSFGGELAWGGGFGRRGVLERVQSSHGIQEAKIGICLSQLIVDEAERKAVNKVFHYFLGNNYPFRVVPEELLTSEWDGLDYLVVVSQGISLQGRRKLLGFCAAGGTVVVVGDSLGLPQEISWIECCDELFSEQ